MSSEKAKILEMIAEGKLTAEEGLELINALDESDAKQKPAVAGSTQRFLRVRVNTENRGTKVNVNVPLSLLKATSKLVYMGMGFIPEEARKEMESKGIDLTKIDLEELVDLIDQGLIDGKLVDVDTDDPQEGRVKVEVFVE